MDEQNEDQTAPFDAELEIIKLQGRFRWLVGELEEFRQKDRSLSARISRLKLKGLEEEEEEEEPEFVKHQDDVRRKLEEMTIEERALLYSKLTK